jgi:hypothetical protein
MLVDIPAQLMGERLQCNGMEMFEQEHVQRLRAREDL